MELTEKLLVELQRRLKIGNRRGVHLNAIPASSRYKFDLNRLSYIDKKLPDNFVKSLLSELPLKFRISWKDNVPDLNSIFEEDQLQLVRITKAFENLINQTEAIESEKGINTFGFGFPILARRDSSDNKVTVAPILIWSLRIKRTREFNTWEILRNEDDPIYINEVLINHLQNDANVEIAQISSDMLDDGLIKKDELLNICTELIRAVNTTSPEDLKETFKKKLDKIVSIGDKAHYEKLPLNSSNSVIEFGGLFSIFEVQKQNIINDYGSLMELEGVNIPMDDIEGHSFQPISSVETDPSQQSILHSLEATRNILIQGPPGTGKSQTLTAVLINALENNKKTIVVCEKRTALEVLHNALIEKGLNYHCVLVRDIVKDRKTVVDSVRDRIDNSEYKRYRYSYSKESLGNLISKASDIIKTINTNHQKLDTKLIGNKCWTDVVGNLLAELKRSPDGSVLNIERSSFNYSTEELDILLEIALKGQILYQEYLPIQSMSFINPLKLVGDNPYGIEQRINEDFAVYAKSLKQLNILLDSIRLEFISLRKSELEFQINSIERCFSKISSKENEFTPLIAKAKLDYMDFRNVEFSIELESISQILSRVNTVFINNKDNLDLIDTAKVNSLSFKLASVFSKKVQRTISDHRALQVDSQKLQERFKNSKDFKALSFKGSIEERMNLLPMLKSEIENISNGFSERVDREFDLFNFDMLLESDDVENTFQSIRSAINYSDNSEALRKKLQSIQHTFSNYLSELAASFNELSKELSVSKDFTLNLKFMNSFVENWKCVSDLKSKLELIKTEFDQKIRDEFQLINWLEIKPSEIQIESLPIFQEKISDLFTKIDEKRWAKHRIECADGFKFIRDVENLILHKDNYFKSEKDLFTIEFNWFQFYNRLSYQNKAIVNELKTKSNWCSSFLIFYLNSILVNSANLELPSSDGNHKELDKALAGIEKEQIKFIKEFWFSKQIDSTRDFEQKNRNLLVENLYNKRSSNRYKRLSLRQIVQYDIDLFTNFFPVILTSPDVASNLFKGLNGYFDIVMFDEASQLRLEDNLPAILKGRQIVIAGDEHQMPPSNYFSKVFDGAVDDEEDIEEDEIVVDKDNILLSCESLLDFGSELNFQKKHLDFHYRSRHPFLIDFSNFAFYKQRLKPLPNNFDYVPIKYVQVNGTFSEHVNEAEAEMVLSILDKNIHRLPNGDYPSVGIATFNITQRNLIKSKILERQKFSKFEEFNAKIQELEENGMFIKNLENIQGDERDVIILSTTYGIDKDRKFAQRFGPINHTKGYKLLNVIITRAKYKVYCCTSIPEQVFMSFKDYLLAEGSNNKRAVFYAYLAYCKAVSDSNVQLRQAVLNTLAENSKQSESFDSFKGGDLESPFEEEVYQSLADHLGTEKLIPQLQFAGFRIDIVYDPKIIGVPKIAIECDGAKYHSSREAYLYDRHRQKILENQGFVFHRIWSTNWWRNSDRETNKLLDFIRQVESTLNQNYKDLSDTALAFTDDTVVIDDFNSRIPFVDIEKDNKTIQAIERISESQLKTRSDEVKLNSIVQLKYVNNGKDITIQIVSTENTKNEKSGDVQKVYFKSPLANSLIGQVVGDIVKVGNLDNFVEILRILN
jgi:very-short-patch-repair endonuclease